MARPGCGAQTFQIRFLILSALPAILVESNRTVVAHERACESEVGDRARQGVDVAVLFMLERVRLRASLCCALEAAVKLTFVSGHIFGFGIAALELSIDLIAN